METHEKLSVDCRLCLKMDKNLIKAGGQVEFFLQ